MELEESSNIDPADRKPCSGCGSVGRALQVNLFETVKVHDFLKLRHKIPGRKKPLSEISSGDDFHRDSKTWRKLERVIDRGKDWYTETIKDSFGEIIEHTSESLSKHTGHGSAKRKS